MLQYPKDIHGVANDVVLLVKKLVDRKKLKYGRHFQQGEYDGELAHEIIGKIIITAKMLRFNYYIIQKKTTLIYSSIFLKVRYVILFSKNQKSSIKNLIWIKDRRERYIYLKNALNYGKQVQETRWIKNSLPQRAEIAW